MKSATKNKIYKSPTKKLVRFFEKSRDNWKKKYKETQKTVRYLTYKMRSLERSRDNWKKKAQEEKEKLRIAEEKIKAYEKKQLPKDFEIRPEYHTYSVGSIKSFVELVINDALSLRGASKASKRMHSLFMPSLQVPEWQTGRSWILRLGYYELYRPKEKADDWVWIVDHSVQIGATKCFVILGIRLKNLPSKRSLSHQDMQVIDLIPDEKSNKEIVSRHLEENTKKTGVPRLIVGDHGPDLKAGVELFCQEHPETDFIYDIKHKTAVVLKKELSENEVWKKFQEQATLSKHRLQKSEFTFLIPPNQRTKSRYMNVDILVMWGQDTLDFLDRELGNKSSTYTQEKLQEKLGWVILFRQSIYDWTEMMRVTETVERFVRTQGLYIGAVLDLEKLLGDVANTKHAQNVYKELLGFITQESSKAQENEKLLGSSEVIESVFGKLKYLEKGQSKSGFTDLVLSIGTMVSSLSPDVILTALKFATTQKLLDWKQKTLGVTIQSQRRKELKNHRKTEQNLRQQFSQT